MDYFPLFLKVADRPCLVVGGGKAAGIASLHLAELFKGAVFICGAEIWSDVEPEHYAMAEENRYVFVTGTRDFNRTLTDDPAPPPRTRAGRGGRAGRCSSPSAPATLPSGPLPLKRFINTSSALSSK